MSPDSYTGSADDAREVIYIHLFVKCPHLRLPAIRQVGREVQNQKNSCIDTARFSLNYIMRIIFFLGIISIISCYPQRDILGESAPALARYQEPEPIITESLFYNPNQTISEADIQRLLAGKIVLPDTIDLAIYPYRLRSSRFSGYYYGTDEEELKTRQRMIDTIQQEIGSSTRIGRLISFPSLLSGSSPDIFQLREAAVRLQADMLMVYTVRSDLYYRYRTFQKNDAKAFATVEVLLLDTRTGVVPHTQIITREHYTAKADNDWSNEELRRRAENGAIMKALGEVGEGVRRFLNEGQ
ncbi:MAG: hypothetical protein AAF741_08930 [Bacteroidota bacterium]